MPPRFAATRMKTPARYSCGSKCQQRVVSSGRVKKSLSPSARMYPPTTRNLESVTSSKSLPDGPLLPMSPHRGPIDVHIARFHTTHRNGVPTTPRSQVVLQEYLKYDRGMASSLVSMHLLLLSLAKCSSPYNSFTYPTFSYRSHYDSFLTNTTSLPGFVIVMLQR